MAVAEVCPNLNDEKYKKIVEKVGEYSALRFYTKLLSSGVDPDRIYDEMESRFTTDVTTKKHKLISADESVEKIKDPDDAEKDIYVGVGSGKKFTRTSEKLNEFPETVYRHTAGESVYAETGTKFHEGFRMTGDKYSPESIKKFLDESGIPAKFQGQAQKFINSLLFTRGESNGSEILVEKKIFSERANLAGQVDLIHLKSDGTIDIYDFKTTYITPKKKSTGEDPWNPVKYDNGYKANRYTAQLEAYGRMVEDVVGHPVSNYYIVPVVVELAEDNKILDFEIRDAENTLKKYGFAYGSKDIMDRVFKHEDVAGSTGYAVTNDDSGKFLTYLTGMPNDYNLSARKMAESVKRTATGYWNGYRDVPFKRGATEAEKIDQIIREYVNNRIASGRSFTQAIKDYITTKESKFLDAYGKSAEGLKTIFKQYQGLSNVEVIDLATVAGFTNKKGWIAVKVNGNMDLYYITEDNLRAMVRTPKNHTGLFAEWFDSSAHASYLQTDLKNIYGDAKAFEAVLIAMKLKEAYKDTTFGNISLYSLYDKGGAYDKTISLGRYLPTVKALWESSKSQKFMPTSMANIFSQAKSFDPEYYAQDYVKLYTQKIRDGILKENIYIKRQLNQYVAQANNRKELSDALARQINSNVELGKLQAADEETRMMAEMYFQLNKIQRDSVGISWWENWVSAPQNHSDPVLQAIYQKTNQAVNRIQKTFWYDYKEEFKKIFDSLVSDQGGIINAPRDYTLGDTSRYFTPLYQTQEVDIVEEGKPVRTETIYNFKLKAEGSPEFRALSTAQQNAIIKINKLMENVAKETGIEWTKGNLPIVRADFYNQLYNARKEQGIEGYKRALGKIFEDVTNIFATTPDQKHPELSNVFLSQAKEGQRNVMMGLTDDGDLINQNYYDFSTNLEVMLDGFMIQGLKYDAFKDLAATIKGAAIINSFKKSSLLDDTLGTTTKHLENVFVTTIKGSDIDSDNPASSPVRAINKGISFATLGWKFSTGLINFLGQEFSMSSQAIANSISKSGGFSISTVTKAHGIVMGAVGTGTTKIDTRTYEKISQLMIKFRAHNQDLSSFQNGFHRYADKTIFKSKMAYGLMHGFDWMARAEMMVAQMLEDGTWDAYDVVKNADGEWELGAYNESKDERWKKLEPKKAKALKAAILQQQKEDGTGDGVTLNDAYDSRYLTKMKAIANNIGGAVNREDRNNAHYTMWGRFFTFFKSWIPVKLDRYVSRPYTSNVMGNMTFEEDANGEVRAVWKGDQMEGILFSWLYTMRNLNGIIKGELPLTPGQKNNLVRSVSDTLLAIALYTLAKGVAGDDDDEWDNYMSKILLGAWGDLAFVYEMMKLDEFYYTPVSLTYLKSRIQSVYNIMGSVGDENSSTLDILSEQLPFKKQFDELDIFLKINDK